MIKIKKIINTCQGCPSQWEGTTVDNRNIYIRYRWGHLSICLRPSGEEILDLSYGDNWDGIMTYNALKELTEGILELPEKEDFL